MLLTLELLVERRVEVRSDEYDEIDEGARLARPVVVLEDKYDDEVVEELDGEYEEVPLVLE